MKKSLFIYIVIICLAISELNFSQIDSSAILSDKLIQYLEETSENLDENQFYEIIEELINNPIEINSANKKELLRIPFLTSSDISLILKKRKQIGNYKSFQDLKSIKGLHPDLLILIKPFLNFSRVSVSSKRNKKTKRQYILNFRSRVLSDIQERAGFLNGNYKGDLIKSYSRLNAKYNKIKLGFIIEKDPGEINFTDHFSGFIQYKPNTIIDNIIIGDFNFEFGQGLVIWSPYSFAKGLSAVTSPLKRNRKFVTFNSSEENKFFRGIATQLNLGIFTLSGFYSIRTIDATLNDNNEITNLYYAGYHRTETEILKKDLLKQNSFGLSFGYSIDNLLEFELLHFVNNFNKPFSFINKNELSGKNFSFSSANYNLFLDKISIVGELGYNGNSFAFINNIYFSLTDNIKILTSYRNYSLGYFNLFANGFGEFSNTQNEIGFYVGTKITSLLGIFNFYYDIFKQPSISFNSSFPSGGNDFLLFYSKKINKNIAVNIKYKHEEKEINIVKNNNTEIGYQVKSNHRLEFSYKLNKHFFGKTRIEVVNYSEGNDKEVGYLSFQDLKYKIDNLFQIRSRIIFFDTESYNTRVYEFENDLRGILTNLPMFGEGFRWYFMFNFSPIQYLTLSIKYAETFKINEKTLGSGNAKIFGNVDNRISFQLDYNLK